MKRFIFLQAIFILINCSLKCQNVKWGDLYDCDLSKKHLDVNQVINCVDFFQIKDSCQLQLFVTWNWTSFPKIENMDSVLNCIVYPKRAEQYKITGKIVVRCLIDKSGKLYCYKIHSELGDLVTPEVERTIHLFRFNMASISDKPVAYEYIIPITFTFEKNDTDNKKRNK